jgi:hypothetical protein
LFVPLAPFGGNPFRPLPCEHSKDARDEVVVADGFADRCVELGAFVQDRPALVNGERGDLVGGDAELGVSVVRENVAEGDGAEALGGEVGAL